MRRLLLVALLALYASIAFAQSPSGTGMRGGGNAGYPAGATPTAAGSTGTTSAVTASIAATAGKVSFLCGFSIGNAQTSTGTIVTAPTVTGVIGSVTLTYEVQNTLSTSNIFSQTFSPCLAGSGQNAAVTVTSPANADASAVAVNAWGYVQ
jgi:hypothetical protein